jgi:glyoxylase-like metal-dependent hydrolase (beta-lactamase superfamily II)
MKLRSTPAWFVCLSLLAAPALAQNNNDPSKVKLVVNTLAPGISMIEGVEGFAGGNVGVSAGNDGMFIIDDELDTMTPKLQAELGKLSKQPLRFVINTHWHGDHTGGNVAFGSSGALILAHDNVRIRLSAAELEKAKDKVVAKPGAGLPVVTFAQDVTLHLNGDDVHVFHVPPAHTDGDVVVQFTKANIVHTGDLFVIPGYPFVDLDSGGNFEGFIGAADAILAVCNDQTRIIPGHGKVSGKADLQAWRDRLETIRQRVAKLIKQGKTLEQAIAAKPTADFDEKGGSGFISPDKIVEAAYRSITTNRGKVGAKGAAAKPVPPKPPAPPAPPVPAKPPAPAKPPTPPAAPAKP